MNRNYEIDSAKHLLGISKQGTAEDAKKKYRDMAKIWHPDINKSEEAHEKMQEINKAFALLMKEEFGILDPWEDYNRWWWRQYGNDPIWGNHYPEDSSESSGIKKKVNILANKGKA
ncbi:MAG: J domain-containing protein [Smithellaceae bacterium]